MPTFSPETESADERLIIVSPGESPWIHQAMLADRVHKIHDELELRTNYLGYGNIEDFRAGNFSGIVNGSSNKLAFALVTDRNVRAVIYVDLVAVPENPDAVKFRNLPGNTAAIIAQTSRPISSGEPINTALFYAISNLGDKNTDPGSEGSGRRLIQGIYRMFNRLPVALSTVSPTPGSGAWLRDNGDPRSGPDIIQGIAVRAAENVDKVGRFHLANGAFIADIKLMPAHAGDREENVHRGKRAIINYGYPGESALRAFATAYKQGVIPMAEPLYEELPMSLRDQVFPVAAKGFRPGKETKGIEIDEEALSQFVAQRSGHRDDSSPDTLEGLRLAPSG